MKENMQYSFKEFQWREGLLEKIIINIHKQTLHSNWDTVWIGDSLIEMIPDTLLPKYHANNGIGGMCSKPLLSLVDELVLKFNPNRVIIHIGTNDLGETMMESPRDIALNVRHLVNLIHANNKEIEIIILSTLPCLEYLQSYEVLNAGVRNNYMISILNKELQTIPNTTFIDLWPVITIDNQPNELYYVDGLHLNPQGYQVISDYLNPLLKEIHHQKK